MYILLSKSQNSQSQVFRASSPCTPSQIHNNQQHHQQRMDGSYTPKDVAINILSWNTVIPIWKEKRELLLAYKRIIRPSMKKSGHYRGDMGKRRNLRDEMLEKEAEILNESISKKWFKEEVDNDDNMPPVPIALKKLISNFAASPILVADKQFRDENKGKMFSIYW